MSTPVKRSNLDSLQAFFKKEEEKIFCDYFTFLKFQTISSEPEYKAQMLICVDWLDHYLKNMGFSTEIWQTPGHPTLFASYTKAGPDKPTLLIYNHYDVQPVDPLHEWKSSPFEASLRDGQIYARGAQDNKGQCFYTIQALRAILECDGQLPINIKLCIEGEEEVGSTGLSSILSDKKNELRADYLAVVDVGLQDLNSPAVTLGVRGLVTMDVEVDGSHTDLHSGSHGGIVLIPFTLLLMFYQN